MKPAMEKWQLNNIIETKLRIVKMETVYNNISLYSWILECQSKMVSWPAKKSYKFKEWKINKKIVIL
jgi:hypothetical protein